MSLRTRLLLAVGLVAFVALAVADVVTYSSLKTFSIDRLDQTLVTTLPGFPGGDGVPHFPPPGAGAGFRGVPSSTFVEFRNIDGTTRSQPAVVPGGKQYSPALPATITVPTGSGSAESGTGTGAYAGQRFLTTGSTPAGGPSFRVLVNQRYDGSQVILGLPLDTVDATLHQLLWIELAVTAAALAAAVALGWWFVRIGLRPLADMERTAEAITEGELDRRIPIENERTEVGRLAGVLNTMLTRIQRAFAERDRTEADLRASEGRMRRFVADASHELRTPLAAVSAYAELFARGADSRPDDLERVMTGIRGESARMTHLVEDLLLLARLDEGRALEHHPVDLVEVAADARDAALTVGPEWPVTLQASEPVEVVGDRLRLRQVLDNLLANVRAHTPQGTSAVVRVARQGDQAVLEVSDDGPGLTEEQAAQAFERFYRADPSRSRDSGGTGLGLSIVAAIVWAAGGTVAAGRGPAGGARFTVTLPAAVGAVAPTT